MESWSIVEVCQFLEKKGFETDVIELFRTNRIRGEVLPLLKDVDYKEIGVVAFGDRKMLLELFRQPRQTSLKSVTKTEELEMLSEPAAFLKDIEQQCPSIVHVLDTRQAKLLSLNGSEPYDPKEVNQQFLDDCSSWIAMRERIDDSGRNLRTSMLRPWDTNETFSAEGFQEQTEVMKVVAGRLKQIIDLRLKATEEKYGRIRLPRLVRLCCKYNLTSNETMIMLYILVNDLNENTRCSNDINEISVTLSIPFLEVFSFLNQDRLHMQEGLLTDNEDGYELNDRLELDRDMYLALIGTDLKQKDLLKIDQTCLAEVILEEPEYQHFRQQIEEESKVTTANTESEDDISQQLTSVEGKQVDHYMAGDQISEDEDISEDDENDDLYQLFKKERMKEQRTKDKTKMLELEGEQELGQVDSDELKPYKKDLEYLDDRFRYIYCLLKAQQYRGKIEKEAKLDEVERNVQNRRLKREAELQCKVELKKCEKRMTITRQSGSWIPRLERMSQLRNLSTLEKNIIIYLIGLVIQSNQFESYLDDCSSSLRYKTTVGGLLHLFCSDLEEEIVHRKCFYKSATLVKEGMIIVDNTRLTGDTNDAEVEIDRRMLDFCVGLDTEFSEIVEGSHLYFPKTKFEQVILSKEQKQLIYDTVSNFDLYKRCRKKLGLNDVITYGAGMVLLFHGPPGTGKTMMANALANKLNKKILLIDYPSLDEIRGDNCKFVFREAKVNDAILFFDECDAIFESDSRLRRYGKSDTYLITEVERHDGLIIMATNRPFDLDEAMHRRITLEVEFRQPDHLLRKEIWESHIPAEMTMDKDVNLDELALRYELTGGFIKNAILSALSIAVSRDGENPLITQADLVKGASLQLRGKLRMKDFDRRVIPVGGLNEVIVDDKLMEQLKEIVQFEKARLVLFGQWGFGKRMTKGLTVLFHGASGTGKTLAAEAIGYEVGKPLKVINCGELLHMWSGGNTKSIDAIFKETQTTDAILMFDEAEALFGTRTETSTSADRYANVDVGVLLYHIERFPGIVILTTNLIDNIDKAFFRRLKFVLSFDIPPRALRIKLWKLLLPRETPITDDVNFELLSNHELTGGNIQNVVFRAASRAALKDKDQRSITHGDLELAVKEELNKNFEQMRNKDFGAARMYN